MKCKQCGKEVDFLNLTGVCRPCFACGKTVCQPLTKSKLRVDLVPPEAIEAIAQVLTFGCSKYEDRGWEKGMTKDELLGSMGRHLLAYQKGELYDKESHLSHLKHALSRLAFLVTLTERGYYG